MANNNTDWTEKVPPDQIYNYMINYYLHQDRLSWSRTQTLIVIEAGLLATSYRLINTPLSVIILFLGTPIIWFIWRLIKRDWDVRDQNLDPYVDSVHKYKDPCIKMVKTAPNWWSRGSIILPLIVYSLIALNILLLICYSLLLAGVKIINLQIIFGVGVQ